MTVVPDSAFVNFMTLAESVALAPMVGFCTSLEVFSKFEVDGLNLFPLLLLLGLLVLWASSYVKSKVPLKLGKKTAS